MNLEESLAVEAVIEQLERIAGALERVADAIDAVTPETLGDMALNVAVTNLVRVDGGPV